MLTLLALLMVTLTLIYRYLTMNHNYWKDRGVPFPKPELFFGNQRNSILLKKTIGEDIQEIYQKFSGHRYVGFFQFMKPALILRDPALLRTLLIKDFPNFQSRGIFTNDDSDPFTANLVNLSGPKWKLLRTKISPAFTSAKLRNMNTLIMDAGKRFQTYVENHVVDKEEDVEISSLVAKFMTEIAGTCLFGLEMNALQNEVPEIRKLCNKFTRPSTYLTVLRFIRQHFLWFFRLFNFRMNPIGVEAYMIAIIKNAIQYRKEHNVVRPDLMQQLIGIIDEEVETDGTITLLVVAAQAYVLLLAGFEASSRIVNFALYELARNPKIQEKLLEEIDSTVEKHGSFSYDVIHGMEYLDRVVRETMRKYSVIDMSQRRCNKTHVFPGTDLTIEEGIYVIVPIMALHRDPEYFPEPEKFDPDRFLDKNALKAYFPFGDGPRKCIGARFASLQIKTCIIYLLMRFMVTETPRTKPFLTYDTTSGILTNKNGIWMKILNRPGKEPKIPTGLGKEFLEVSPSA
ncbi:probable cytochrome P450 6a14 isoform X2 [Orussus abietinus]|uniref:probable cytochrome P450 6a14 isoform X2 n=1 Tax=Orussus abietinus TaxID=222816 RepID=UPI0006263342|nr:probable cytochrome P450 6a14 isoform X2 [Orussus abietinus]